MPDWDLTQLKHERRPPRRHSRSCPCDCFWRGMAAGIRLERAQTCLRRAVAWRRAAGLLLALAGAAFALFVELARW